MAKKKIGFQTDKMFFTGIQLALSDRNGAYYLSDDKKFEIFPSPLLSGGVEIGQRFPIGLGFRLELPAVLNIGSTWEDVPGSIALQDGTSQVLILKKMYITIGLTPQLQYVLPLDNKRMKCYVSAGGGVHYSVYSEDERIKEKPSIRIMDYNLEEARRVCGSADVGMGIDWVLSKRQAISLMYKLRYWKPVNYSTEKDLFPYSSVKYVESMFTNMLSIKFLVRLF
ncbi:MAG: hypothetical protein JW915_15345 [Chitinispirillaceae bacterium]|nr:hypothetical protein [Chitinispirillaceae bacterium]